MPRPSRPAGKPVLVTVVGARPQFIKCAPVSEALRPVFREILVHTGQHYDEAMSDVFFRDLDLPPPSHHLGVGSGTHGAQTAAMLERIEKVLVAEKPQMVLLYGDTNSTIAGALAAAKLSIPIVHVEAGLRSFNRHMPEEINRIVTDTLSSLLFCPTDTAVTNLRREGITKHVHLVGDVMLDSLRRHVAIAARKSRILRALGVTRGSYFLATVHRAENTDDPENLGQIMAALGAIARSIGPVVFPVHPRTKQRLTHVGVAPARGLIEIAPVSYLDMLALEQNSRAILTDSGGVQKEAFWLGVPCVTLRQQTEWVETVKSGWNVIAGTNPRRILAAIRRRKPRSARRLGRGSASQRIARLMAGALRARA